MYEHSAVSDPLRSAGARSVKLLRERSWLVIIALWTLYGLISAAQSHYRFTLAGRTLSWADSLVAEVSFTWMWALATPVILWVGRRFPVRKSHWLLPLCVHLITALAVSVVTKTAWDVLIYPHVFTKATSPYSKRWLDSMLMTLDYGLLMYSVVVVTQHAVVFLRLAEEDRLRATRLEAELARAQLSALKMQLHPHFLFNTLHAVTELIEHEPEKAERMVVRLSELLRYTIDQFGVHEVTLAQELDYLKRYLEIEKIRFEDRLRVEYDIDPATLTANVPNFLLQPLVENALRHGIQALNRPGVLRIKSQVEGDTLALEVFDTGPGIPDNGSAHAREGVGLGNTRRRLERLFGPRQSLGLMNVNSGGFLVTVHIPYRLVS
jgi:two-component system, LytTR family, sensor kinase